MSARGQIAIWRWGPIGVGAKTFARFGRRASGHLLGSVLQTNLL